MSTHPEVPGHGPKNDPHTFSQDFKIANLSARVPERVARGVFSTGVLVLQGASEFVLDFVLRMNQPHQVVARVILPNSLVPQFIDVMKTNLENYRKSFGQAPATPPPPPNPPPKPPSIEEIYQDLKISDEVMAGAYANTVMVVHSAADFCFEFISNYYPKAIITARVFMSAPQVPPLLNTLTQSWQNYQNKLAAKREENPPPA